MHATQTAHAVDMLEMRRSGLHRRARRGRARLGRAARSAAACWPAASARPAAASARATSAAWCTPAARMRGARLSVRFIAQAWSLLAGAWRRPARPLQGGSCRKPGADHELPQPGKDSDMRMLMAAWSHKLQQAGRNTAGGQKRSGMRVRAAAWTLAEARGGAGRGGGGRRAFFTPPNSSSSTLSVSEKPPAGAM